MRFRPTYRIRAAAFSAAVVALALPATTCAGRGRRVQTHRGGTRRGSLARALRENAVAPAGNCYRRTGALPLESAAPTEPLVGS